MRTFSQLIGVVVLGVVSLGCSTDGYYTPAHRPAVQGAAAGVEAAVPFAGGLGTATRAVGYAVDSAWATEAGAFMERLSRELNLRLDEVVANAQAEGRQATQGEYIEAGVGGLLGLLLGGGGVAAARKKTGGA